MLQPLPSRTDATEPLTTSKPHIQAALNAIEALRAADPYALAALLDYLRTEWRGTGAIDITSAVENIVEETLAMKLAAIRDNAEGILCAAVAA